MNPVTHPVSQAVVQPNLFGPVVRSPRWNNFLLCHGFRLLHESDLFAVLSDLGYSSDGKCCIVLELFNCGLLLFTDKFVVTGCDTRKTFPGHLQPVCTSIVHNQRIKREGTLLSKRKRNKVVAEKRKALKQNAVPMDMSVTVCEYGVDDNFICNDGSDIESDAGLISGINIMEPSEAENRSQCLFIGVD